jgi:hypothetical protein
MQKIVSFDSQTLNAIQKCARFTDLHFNSRYQPLRKAEAIEKGSLMHEMLDIYYSLSGKCLRPNPEWLEPLVEAGLVSGRLLLAPTPHASTAVSPPAVSLQGETASPQAAPHASEWPTEFADIVRFAISAGEYLAVKMDLEAAVSESVIYQFSEYCKYYQHDGWHPLAVEEVGSKVLYEDEDLKIIYNFKIDLIAEKGTILAPWDHKTASQRKEPTSVSNQFIGYCYGLGVDYIVVNKIGFQKTLPPKERFQRFTLQITPQRIDEWVVNSIYWAKQYLACTEADYWPMNLTSCDKYSGCIYLRQICEVAPENRLYNLERDFKIGDEWDVANALEGE